MAGLSLPSTPLSSSASSSSLLSESPADPADDYGVTESVQDDTTQRSSSTPALTLTHLGIAVINRRALTFGF